MKFFEFFRLKKKEDPEAKRREFLSNQGRIADGTIIDTAISESGEEIAYYSYSIAGVDFESSEILTDEQRQNSIKYAPGAKVGIRFDPRNHGNSMLM
jgi:hypothetical protein